jgi:AraC family transcriptional regulator
MTVTSRLLASGAGWRARDIVCTSGPRDRSFEEQHDGICIAVVTEGTFQYRSNQGTALLVPGAVLLGNDRHCFECSHDHAVGDRCLSFQYTPEFFAAVTASGGPAQFVVPRLPPSTRLIPLVAAAEAARDRGDGGELEEAAIRLAAAVADTLCGTSQPRRTPSRSDQRRITAVLRRIEQQPNERWSIVQHARDAAMSPYHFLRTFRAVVGMTPHQFVLRTRLNQAAISLRRSRDSIAAIAFDAGFNDLSTFNRRFRRLFGQSPSAYRVR